MDAGDALDERRLAGAVVADERHDLAGAHLEVDVGQRHRAERLREVADLEEWCVAHECGVTRERRWRRASRASIAWCCPLLAVLLVLPGADLAPLEEPVPEEPRVVRLGDRVTGMMYAAASCPCSAASRWTAASCPCTARSRPHGSVRLVGHVLVDRVGLPARDDVLDALDGRVLPRERDGLEPFAFSVATTAPAMLSFAATTPWMLLFVWTSICSKIVCAFFESHSGTNFAGPS